MVLSRIRRAAGAAIGAVVDTDMGWSALLDTVRDLDRSPVRVEVGISGDAADRVHPSSNKGETIAEIAAKHEFGIGVPQRSFLRSTFEDNRDRYQKLLGEGVVDEALESVRQRRRFNPNSSTALKRLALQMEGDVKKKIARGIPPPNAPSTIKRKGSSTPLIDTGLLRQSVGALVARGRKS